MTKPRDETEIILHLRPLPASSPWVHRLRSVLKRLLRDYGFRCTQCLLPPDEKTSDGQPQQREEILE